MKLVFGIIIFSLFKLFLNILFKLVKSIEFTDVLSKFIIKCRYFLNLYTMKLNFEHSILRSEISLIILREFNINIKLVPDFVADNLIFKAGNKLIWAYGKLIFFSLSALKRLAVNKALKVDNNYIVLFNRSVINIRNSWILLLHPCKLSFNFICRNLGRFLCSLKALILAELNLRLNSYFELHGYTVIAHLGNFKVIRCINRFKLRFLNSGSYRIGIYSLKSVLIEHTLAVIFFNKSTRSLSFSKSRNGNVLSLLKISLCNGILKSVAIYAYFKLPNIGIHLVWRF